MYDPTKPKSFADMGVSLPKQNETTINGKKFIIQAHSPYKYWPNLVTIVKNIGVPFSFLVDVFQQDGDVELSECVPEFMGLLCQNLDEGRFIALTEIILQDVLFEGSSFNVDEVFKDDPENVLLLVAKTLEVRYSGLGKLDFSILGSLTGMLGMMTRNCPQE